MKSLVNLLYSVLADAGTVCHASTTADCKTISRRVENEGIGFLTITLPSFCRDFERSLELGCVDSTLFLSFRKRACLPAFLQGFTSLVFNTFDGTLLDNPSIEAIQAIRQICNLFKKLELPPPLRKVEAALDAFIECDNQVVDTLDEQQIVDFSYVSALLFGNVLSAIDRKVFNGEIVPKHGPGATADKLFGNRKFANRIWTERLEDIFSASEFMFPSISHYLSGSEGITWLEPGSEPPVKVITVPKTLETPRVIAIEPSWQQYCQQGLMESIVQGLEGSDNPFNTFIGFTDQEPNRALAQIGSETGELATLDLSEASDRVSTLHVQLLTQRFKWLNRAVFACRSSKAEIPGRGIRPLRKYASMGSALTFPLEAMVFTTIVFIGIANQLRVPLTPKLIREFKGKVRVYGDDIIVPVHYACSVSETLEAFGLKVNRHKSFWNGKFRESCGREYYSGFDVSIVKVRRLLPETRHCVEEMVSAVSLRNQLYKAGYWKAANYMESLIRKFIPFPTVHESSPCLGRHTFLSYQTDRMCPTLQRPLVKGVVVNGVLPSNSIEGCDALMKFFLKRGESPFNDEKHLIRSGRPRFVTLKPRWVTPY